MIKITDIVVFDNSKTIIKYKANKRIELFELENYRDTLKKKYKNDVIFQYKELK